MSQLTKQEFREQLRQTKQEAITPSVNPFGPGASHRTSTTSTPAPAASQPRPRLGPKKEYKIPSVAEYRGTTAKAAVKPTKNEASDPRQTSLPMREMSKTELTMAPHRQPNDITAHQMNALATGFGSMFTKENCKTSRGWQSGSFS
jgi:hypothetical protein